MPKSLRVVFAITGFLLILFALGGCSKDNPIEPLPSGPIPIQNIVNISGTLLVSDSAAVSTLDLELNTMAATVPLDETGHFTVGVPEADKYQIILFNAKTTGETVYMGLYDPSNDDVLANDTSTGLALALLNPYLAYADSAQRREYLQEVKGSQRFAELMDMLESAYRDDPLSALDYEKNPLLYQKLASVMKEAMQNLGAAQRAAGTMQPNSDPPYVQDGSGDNIEFVNPSHVFFAAGIYPDDGQQMSRMAVVQRTEKVISMQWGWPPMIFTEPAITDIELLDGYYRIFMTQGYDFSKILQVDEPMGRATALNTAQGIVYLVDVVLGIKTVPGLISLPQHLKISGQRANQLSQAIVKGDLSDFVVLMLKLVVDNSKGIADWYFGSVQNDAAEHFVRAAGGLLKNVCQALKVLGFLNEQAPFFWDIAFTPHEMTYFVMRSNGDITSTEQDYPPVASFVITPPAGIVGVSFAFDASSSRDDFDDPSSLRFRWNFDGDGLYDTDWSSSTTTTHNYSSNGAYQVILQVRDTRDQIGSVIRTLSVGGGAGTASHVKLFRDTVPWYRSSPPWDIDATVAVLENLGFVYGTTGQNTYEIVPSSEFATAPMVPGQDLIVISNDQSQQFYDNYAASQVRFNNFVHSGGSILWEACDLGWNEGSMAYAGVELPSGISISAYTDNYNYVVMQDLPLVAGLPYQLDHNYASHEEFGNLPEGTTIYCTATSGGPTLVEYNFGAGWVIVTGQPLEHQYKEIYGSPDMEQLLPRLLGYFTGKGIMTAPAPKLTPAREGVGENANSCSMSVSSLPRRDDARK